MEIRDHRLFDPEHPIPFHDTPNMSGQITPEVLVMHFTKGASAKSSVNWLANPKARASAHLVIGKLGEITQLVDFNRRAWHAGRSRWNGKSGLNGFSIGVELDNYGDLIGEKGNWRTTWGRKVPDHEVAVLAHKFDGKERGWNFYSEKQLECALKVCQTLVSHYGLKDVVGHEDISPGRKYDPGPAFPMAGFKTSLFGREDDLSDLYETITALNIRTGPGTEHAKLSISPLPERTEIEISAEAGLWRQVSVLTPVNGEMDIVGWVHSKFIRQVL